MATKQKISPEDATILKTYGTSPATKRFARDLMLEGKTLEEVIKTCQNIAKKEQEIKNTWYRAMLREMSDQRFDGTTYELQNCLKTKLLSPKRFSVVPTGTSKNLRLWENPKAESFRFSLRFWNVTSKNQRLQPLCLQIDERRQIVERNCCRCCRTRPHRAD